MKVTVRIRHFRPAGVVGATLVAALHLLLPTQLLAQSTNRAGDTLLETEQAILDSLSAKAVAYTIPKAETKSQPRERGTAITVKSPSVAHNPTSPKQSSVVTKEQKEVAVAKKATEPVAPTENKSVPQTRAATDKSTIDSSPLKTANAELQRQVQAKDLQIQSLQREVLELRSQLSVAEVEVSRLSSIVDAKTRASLDRYKISAPAANQGAALTAPVVEPERRVVSSNRDVRPPSPETALQVATISVQKAELRLGPGTNHSALMPLPRGSRLTVETRQGEWLRVFAPSGERAWIHSSLVTFGSNNAVVNERSAVAVKGFSANVEEEAFRRLQRGVPTK